MISVVVLFGKWVSRDFKKKVIVFVKTKMTTASIYASFLGWVIYLFP